MGEIFLKTTFVKCIPLHELVFAGHPLKSKTEVHEYLEHITMQNNEGCIFCIFHYSPNSAKSKSCRVNLNRWEQVLKLQWTYIWGTTTYMVDILPFIKCSIFWKWEFCWYCWIIKKNYPIGCNPERPPPRPHYPKLPTSPRKMVSLDRHDIEFQRMDFWQLQLHNIINLWKMAFILKEKLLIHVTDGSWWNEILMRSASKTELIFIATDLSSVSCHCFCCPVLYFWVHLYTNTCKVSIRFLSFYNCTYLIWGNNSWQKKLGCKVTL